jgi:hypothetical protein
MAAASLLLCIAAATMWLRSYGGTDIATCNFRLRDGSGYGSGIESCQGRFIVFGLHLPAGLPDEVYQFRFQRTALYFLALDPASDGYKRRTLFGYGLGWWYPAEGLTWHLLLPWWIVLVLSALLPVRLYMLWRRRWRRERWIQNGLCPSCGYDLRASPGKCPECGMPPTRPAEMA